MEELDTGDKLNDEQFKSTIKAYLDDPKDIDKKKKAVNVIEELLKKHSEIIDYIDTATSLGKCRFDIEYSLENPFLMKLPHLQPIRTFAKLLKYRAILFAAKGEPEQAINTIRQMLILSQYLADEPLIISTLVQVAIDAISIDCLEEVLAITSPSVKQQQQLIAEIQKTKKELNHKK